MLVTINPQRTLWETILPPGYQDLPGQAPEAGEQVRGQGDDLGPRDVDRPVP